MTSLLRLPYRFLALFSLVSVAAFGQVLQVLGTSLRGRKPRDELLKGAALAAHVGRRARKGRAVEGMKAQRVVAAAA